MPISLNVKKVTIIINVPFFLEFLSGKRIDDFQYSEGGDRMGCVVIKPALPGAVLSFFSLSCFFFSFFFF